MGGLRVLLIGPFPEEEGKIVGGVQAVTSTLAQALSVHEVVEKVTVLSFLRRGGVSRRADVSDRLQVWYLAGQERLALPTRAFLEVLRARRVVAEARPDVIHGQGIGIDGYIATCMSNDAVVTAHGLINREVRLASRRSIVDRARVRLVDMLVRRVLGQARVVISTSHYDARVLEPSIRGRHVSIPNPVHQEYFSEGLGESLKSTVLFAGMMLRRKNVLGLVRAFGRLLEAGAEAKLVIMGPALDGAYLSEVREEVESLRMQESVEFVGHVDTGYMLATLRACSVVALFSYEETSPTVIAQAMAAGKPVVASRVGGVPEMVIDGETGYLVDADDEKALADRLVVLLESPTLSAKMGARGREIAMERFEASVVASQTVQAYRIALGL